MKGRFIYLLTRLREGPRLIDPGIRQNKDKREGEMENTKSTDLKVTCVSQSKDDIEVLERGGYFRGCYNMSREHREEFSALISDCQNAVIDDSIFREGIADLCREEYRPRLLTVEEATEVFGLLRLLASGEYLPIKPEEQAAYCLKDVCRVLGISHLEGRR